MKDILNRNPAEPLPKKDSGNLKQRFADHNAGKSVYTAQYKPWKMIGFLGFDTEEKALQFACHAIALAPAGASSENKHR